MKAKTSKLYPNTALLLLEHKDFSNKKNKQLYLNNFAEHEIFDIMAESDKKVEEKLANFIEKCKKKGINNIQIDCDTHGVLFYKTQNNQKVYIDRKLRINANLLYDILEKVNGNFEQVTFKNISCNGAEEIDFAKKEYGAWLPIYPNEKNRFNLKDKLSYYLGKCKRIAYQRLTNMYETECGHFNNKGMRYYHITQKRANGETLGKRAVNKIENQYELQNGERNLLPNCGVLTKPTIAKMKKDTTTKISKNPLPQNVSNKSKKVKTDEKIPMDTIKPKTEYRKIKNKEPQDSKRKKTHIIHNNKPALRKIEYKKINLNLEKKGIKTTKK